MALAAKTTIDVLRAIGEDTRFRIALLLHHGELTVSDLTDILGQSQPRISRHLKLLTEAGVVEKHREGTWAFFDLVTTGPIADVVGAAIDTVDPDDPVLAADLDRLALVRNQRAATAQEYFAAIAERWDEERSLHAPDDVVEAAIVEALAERPYHSVLDMGTGTGRMLQLLIGDRLDVRAIGLDNSHSMLGVARANLERAEVHGVDLRQGDVYSPPVEPGFDLVVVHQVLHFLHDPARAVHEARRLLNPGGRLLIVDFAPHALEFLRTDHAHRRLGFRDDTIVGWLEQSGLRPDEPCRIEPQHGATNPDDERLVVTLWLAHDRAAAPTTDSPTDAVPEGALR
ncbi:ArsR family transcriptional regulator [Ilumatobacter fluminis]|uniref:ArsR family transcriptional regulator n=1 Tax=Ilumatobacter fluminis TaxID=467091 RepID=A0A4R7HY07_9ACTN|nr:metalloregulator ArsR/SmtB family transcription factor [Ilumatobacter fluminis]TDT15013.1 ArsR family transcriptional regulator [Ilumatobacter fluminis]